MSESGAAFGAAIAQNIAAGTCGHALKKAVLSAALSLFGLICSLWHMSIL